MGLVNPLTALGLFDSISIHGSKAAIQAGAASQLGRMICHLANEAGTPLINIVRR